MWKKRGSRREEYGRKTRAPKDDYRPWNSAILTKQPESNISDNNRNSREIKETSEEGVTAAAVLGSDVPSSYSTWRYSNLVALGIVEPKKPFEKHWTYSEAQKNMHDNDEMMNDAPQEPPELVPRHGNQYKPLSNRQAAPRQDAPRQDAPRQDAPRQDAPRQDAPRQDAPRQDAPRQDAPRQDAPRQDAPRQDAPRQDAPRQDAPRQSVPRQDAPRQDAPRQDAPRQSVPRQYRNDNIKQSAKDTSAKSNIAEVTFRLVGSGFRRAEALIVDINSSNSPNTNSYYPNSSSSSPASVNSPLTPDDPLLSPLFELNEALMSQVKTMKIQNSSKGSKAKPDKGGWKENWAQGYGNIW